MTTITVNDVQKIIGYPIWAKIPSDYKVAVNALNRGIPFVTGAPNSKLSESICELVDILLSGSYKNVDMKQKKKNNFSSKLNFLKKKQN
jgi:pilus assembly protein CpaE